MRHRFSRLFFDNDCGQKTYQMQPIKIGILADTHLSQPAPHFQARIQACFAETPIIIHAGDLTEVSILEAFAGKEIHAVHGNMCSLATSQLLPTRKTIVINNFSIGIIHRAGHDYDFEDALPLEFDAVDCIVYGHTHRPACHRKGGVLYINPGSFMATGRHGARGTYAVLELGPVVRAAIYEVPLS